MKRNKGEVGYFHVRFFLFIQKDRQEVKGGGGRGGRAGRAVMGMLTRARDVIHIDGCSASIINNLRGGEGKKGRRGEGENVNTRSNDKGIREERE